MHKVTPPRKIKARLHLLVVLLSIFLATLALCGIIFVVFVFSGITLISPVTNTKDTSVDAQIAQIQLFCQQNHISCTNIQSSDKSSIQITLDTNAVIFLSTKKDLKTQLNSLQEALSQLTIKGKQFKKLDFRFANTVVTF